VSPAAARAGTATGGERYPGYPFASHWFTHPNGLRQHYVDHGTGAPVLMLHGNPTWSYYWRRLVIGLADRARSIAPDHIGMGLSDKPDDRRYGFRLADRVEDLERLFQHLISRGLPERGWTLVVHDWGGMIGCAWATAHPERIARLVVLNTAAFPNPKGQRIPAALRLARDSAFGAFLIRRFNAFAAGATRLAVMRPLPADVRAAYVAPYDTPAHRLATLRFVQDIPLGPSDPSYELVVATGERLPVFADRPIAIHWGRRDFVFDDAFLAEWRRRFPDAEVYEYPDAGHYVLEDAHEHIVPRIRAFLAAAR
jgi:haloalkane dehalogenase